MLIRAHPWEIEAPLYFFLKNRIFQTFLTKNLHFALFICQYGFFFVPLRAFYGGIFSALKNTNREKHTYHHSEQQLQ